MPGDSQSILILYTGGTIGMVEGDKNKSLRPLDFEHISNEVPEIKRFPHFISCISLDQAIDSSNVQPGNWVQMAEIILENYSKFDGFVVLHGTDTMAYSASALSFMLENLNKPVIFTGSQLPIGLIRTDARENIISAIEIATAKNLQGPMVPGVTIYFENKLFQGNRTTKFSAENFNAFISPNYPVLAESGVHLKYNRDAITYPKQDSDLVLHKKLNKNIALLKIFPGISPIFVQRIFDIPKLEAVILETFGSGNALTEKWFENILADYISRGGIILNVTQCPAGMVEQGKYETSIHLNRIGVIGGSDITTEAAITKLMFVLGQEDKPEITRLLLKNSIRGEIS